MFDGLGRDEAASDVMFPDVMLPDLAAHVGPAGWARLAPAVRWRFGAGQAGRARTYHGAMDVWRSPVGLAFALVGRLFGGPLPVRQGRAVPAEVRVRPAGDGMVWDRRLRFSAAHVERVSSTKQDGPAGLVERTGAGLAMELDVLEQGGALVFRSRRYLLQLGRWRIPIPALLTPGTCEVRHVDAGPGRFRFTLTAIHPVWGATFRQDGLFHDPGYSPNPQSTERSVPC